MTSTIAERPVRRARENGRTVFKVFGWYSGNGDSVEEFTVVSWQNAYDQTAYSCLACTGHCRHVKAVEAFIND